MAIDRYHRQTLLPQIGSAGQAKLAASSVLLVGCGALGSTVAEQLARAGIGRIRIADRDIVEMTNLQRQVLYEESDAREGLPKAIAAAQRLAKINSGITIEPLVVDIDADNIESLVAGVHLIVDGTDNVATRYLINDVSVKHGLPWIYGACVGTEGRVMTIQPTRGPCLRCVFPKPPDPTELATCDTAGVLGPVASVIGSLQAMSAIKLLSGNLHAIANELVTLDLWNNRMRSVSLLDAKRADCATCAARHFEFLTSPDRQQTAKLCGRSAVQVRAGSNGTKLTLDQIAQRLGHAGSVQVSPFMVRCTVDAADVVMTAFGDGRVIVQGTADPARARSLVARYLGS